MGRLHSAAAAAAAEYSQGLYQQNSSGYTIPPVVRRRVIVTYAAQDRGRLFHPGESRADSKNRSSKDRRPPWADLYQTSQVTVNLSDIPAVHHDLGLWTGRSRDHLAATCHFHWAVKCQQLPGKIVFLLQCFKKGRSIKKPAIIMSEILAVIRLASVPTFNTT